MQRWLKKFGSVLAIASVSLFVFLLLPSLVVPARSTLETSQAAAIFDEVWQTVNDNFYDPKFNGVDWKAVGEKYEPSVKQAQSIEEAALVINQMLSELKTSHTRFYTQAEPAYYQLLGVFNRGSFSEELSKIFPNGKLEYTDIGVFTKEVDGKTFISAILDGSPAAQAGLLVGDQILAVAGKPYQAIASFLNKAEQEVTLSIQRTPDANSVRDIAVVPKVLKPDTLFLDTMQASIDITEREGKKLGYIHVWSYAGDQYQELLTDELTYGKLKETDGLVLDLRDGWGGANPSYLSIFTAQTPTLTSVGRRGQRTTEYSWKKPVVMLVNQGTRSGKEILAYGFQQYDIGPVVGTKTAGAVVGGSPFLMKDNSLLYLAVVDVFVDGERLEGKGVIPDIEVTYSLEYSQGEDPQKEKAFEVLLEAAKTQQAA